MNKSQLQKVKKIAKKHHLDFVILFGSHARGDPVCQESDLDLAIYRQGGIKFKDFLKLATDFDGLAPGKQTDLLKLNKANALIRYNAIKDGILLHGDPEAYHQYQAYAYQSRVDLQPLLNLQHRRVRQGIHQLASNYAH